MKSDLPHIVLTIADDQRFDLVGALGHPDLRTPSLDRMVHLGTSFTRAYTMGSTHAAVCVPSRAMLHTGLPLYHVPDSIRGAWGPFQPSALTEDSGQVRLLGERLGQAGYFRAGVGKWHNGVPTFARSFDEGGDIFFDGMSDHFHVPVHDFDPSGVYAQDRMHLGRKHSTELFGDRARQCIVDYVRRGADQPLFLYVAFTAPHDPRQTLPQWHAQYQPRDVALPSNFLPEHPFDNGELQIRDELLASHPRTETEVRRHIADYYAMTAHMDDAIGRIHRGMEQAGLADNTIFIHTSDHGLAVGQHGLMGKQNLYEHSLRVPLLVQGPGFAAGRREEGLRYMHDLYPTLLQIAGETPDRASPFQFLLDHTPESQRSTIFSAYRECQRMVRDERYKLIEYRVRGKVRTQLFDLKHDPAERHDVSGDPSCAVVLARLRQTLSDWQARVCDPCAADYRI